MKKAPLLSLMLTLIVGVMSVRAQDVPVLTYWDTLGDNERPIMQEMITDCETSVGVGVDHEYVPLDSAQANFRTAARAGNAPDILRSEIDWMPEYASLGYLVDLTDQISSEERASYLEAPFNYNVWRGHIWGLPQVTDAPALLYNKDLFTRAGLDPDNPPATMDDLRAAAEAITALGTDAAPLYGIATLWGSYPFPAFIWAYGGDLITTNDDGSYTIGINSDSTYAAFDFITGLLNDGLMGPTPYDPATQYAASAMAFKEGQAGMFIMGDWQIGDILTGSAFTDPTNLGVAPVPAGSDGDQGSPVSGHEYVIYAGSAHPEAALALIRCLNSVDHQARLATDLNLIPTLVAAYDDPSLADNLIVQGFFAQMQVARNNPLLVAGNIYHELEPQYAAVMLGERTPQVAMNLVVEAWQSLLDLEPTLPSS